MKWVGISGSWRITSKEVEDDVRREVRELIARGDGIVSGGALGVDYVATDEALRHNPSATQIKIFLPSTLEIYAKHYRNRADEDVITHQQAEDLITQLAALKNTNPDALIEGKHDVLNPRTYYERNSWVIGASNELLAFQVNGSQGVSGYY